jgi:hypothetical protein
MGQKIPEFQWNLPSMWKKNLPQKPFEYKYYSDMEYVPSGISYYKQAVRLREYIAAWIIAHDP